MRVKFVAEDHKKEEVVKRGLPVHDRDDGRRDKDTARLSVDDHGNDQKDHKIISAI
jgi:hypothetical protein